MVQITIQGFFTEYDKYNRAKIMFLDDYDDITEPSFTKKYIYNRDGQRGKYGNNPLSDDGKYFLINCPKNAIGHLSHNFDSSQLGVVENNLKIAPIKILVQHKVECVVKVSPYNFKNKSGMLCRGWNFKLIKMSLLEL